MSVRGIAFVLGISVMPLGDDGERLVEMVGNQAQDARNAGVTGSLDEWTVRSSRS